MMWNGRPKLIKGNLDFILATPRGAVGFFDTKSFVGEKFRYSVIDEHQLELAQEFEIAGIKSGFIIYFRDLNNVRYFKASKIIKHGPGSSIPAVAGKDLGDIMYFDLKKVFR